MCCCSNRPVTGAGTIVRCFRVVVGRHDSSVMSRYSTYSANQEMTTTATISMISKNNTTGSSLFVSFPVAASGDKPVWLARAANRSGDLDVYLVDARTRRHHHSLAIASRRQL